MMFQVLCEEKGGSVLRTVRLMPRKMGHIMEVMKKVQSVPNFLSKINPAGVFIDTRNTFFEVDDVGLVAVIPLGDGIRGSHVHVTFWDRRLRGREQLCRILAELVTELRHEPLWTAVPEELRIVTAFCMRVGFTVWRTDRGIVTLRYDRTDAISPA